MMKHFGLIALISLVLISLAFILYPEIKKPVGVIITSVGANSQCKDIMTVGSVVTGVGNKIIENSNEFVELTKNLEGVVTFIINNNPRSCNIPKESVLNVSVVDVKRGGIKLGTDLWGGVDYFFKTEELSKDLIENIRQRSVKYGLTNTKIELYNNTFVKITTGSDEESYVDLLTEQGKLEGRIVETIDLNKPNVEFTFNDNPYEISLKDKKSVTINKTDYEVKKSFKLDGVDVLIENISENTTTLSIKIFDEKDLTLIQNSRSGYSRIAKQGSGYVFVVPVELSGESSEAFTKATKNLEVIVNPSTGESYSKDPIVIFIDEKQFVSIPIISDDMGKERKDLILWGYSSNIEEATKNMVKLKTIIEIKSLSQKLTIVKRGTFKSSYGELLTTLLLSTTLIVFVATIILFFVKFRKSGAASLPLILMILSESVLIFGVVATNWFALIVFCVGFLLMFTRGDIYNWKNWVGVFLFLILLTGLVMSRWVGGWVFDAPFVVGLIAVVIIGVAQNVFMGMKILAKKESYTLSDYKNALNKLWLFSTVFAFILIILYFVANFTGFMSTSFIMVVSVGLWINLSLISPVYADITKKFIK